MSENKMSLKEMKKLSDEVKMNEEDYIKDPSLSFHVKFTYRNLVDNLISYVEEQEEEIESLNDELSEKDRKIDDLESEIDDLLSKQDRDKED